MININPFWPGSISYLGFSDFSEIEEENIIRVLKTRKCQLSRSTWVHPDFCGFCGIRVAQYLVFCAVFCRSLLVPFVLFLLAININIYINDFWLPVCPTIYDFWLPVGIIKLFLWYSNSYIKISRSLYHKLLVITNCSPFLVLKAFTLCLQVKSDGTKRRSKSHESMEIHKTTWKTAAKFRWICLNIIQYRTIFRSYVWIKMPAFILQFPLVL
jgi:hypothetical protein